MGLGEGRHIVWGYLGGAGKLASSTEGVSWVWGGGGRFTGPGRGGVQAHRAWGGHTWPGKCVGMLQAGIRQAYSHTPAHPE